MTLSLESILESPNSNLFKEFTAYLNQSYCIENLAFWLATQDYHKNQKLGEAMIDLYIRPNAPQEINIPCDMRRAILQRTQFHQDLFDEAAETVMELMRVNSFIPWSYERRKLQHSTSAHALSSFQSMPVQRRCSSLDYTRPREDQSMAINSSSVHTRYKSILKRVKRTLLFNRPML